MNGIRIVRDIESAVRERESRTGDSQKHNPSSGVEYINAWRAKLREILSILGVRRFELTTIPRFDLQLFQGDLGQGSALGPSTDQEHVQRSTNSEMDSAPALVMVRHGFVTCAPRSLLTICSTQPMSVSSICKHPEFPN